VKVQFSYMTMPGGMGFILYKAV